MELPKIRTFEIQKNSIKQAAFHYSANHIYFCMDSGRLYRISIYNALLVVCVPASGAIAILCSLSHRKEESAGKYYSVFSMPLNLSKFEMAKGMILIEKLLVAGVFLALLISISNIISPAQRYILFRRI